MLKKLCKELSSKCSYSVNQNESNDIMHENRIARLVVHSALNVHKKLGPGLLESTYQSCLDYELKKLGLQTEKEAPMPVIYDDIKLDCGYRVDLWVERKVILELKAVKEINDVHRAQILTYLKLSDNKLGLLINFNVSKVKYGIKRVVNGL